MSSWLHEIEEKMFAQENTFKHWAGCVDAGKSAIHGLGAFCKVPHKAGDMVTEYVGELVRPPVADARERKVYDRMVGSGTYVFTLNEEFCVDATRQGLSGFLVQFASTS